MRDQLQAEVLTRLGRRRDIMVMRINSGLFLDPGGRGQRVRAVPPGTPDVLVLGRGGEVVWLELKRGTGRLSDVQKRWHARAKAVGQWVYTVRTVEAAEAAVDAHIGVAE